MKRVGYLFPQVAHFEALIQASKRAKQAGGSKLTLDAAQFYADRESRCLALRDQLLTETYLPGPYHSFMIHEPKARLISAAPFVDRVVHHSLCAVLEPYLERFAIGDSYACRKDKGLHKAITRAQSFSRRYSCFLKLDIQHYFETISHRVLKKQLSKRFKDERLLRLCAKIIDHGAPGSLKGFGLPIGNLTSQHLANFYLSHLDRYIKQDLNVKGYVRYMDDFILFSHRFSELKQWKKDIESFLETTLELSLKKRSERLDWVRSGVPFLGARIFKGLTRFDQGRKKRLCAKLHHLHSLYDYELTELSMHQYNSLRSWATLTNSEALLNSWYKTWPLTNEL